MWLYLTSSVQSPTAKSNHTAKASSCRECKKEICPKHQFGTMYEHYHMTNCPELISYTEDFHARTLALLEMEKAWRESEAVFFSKSCAWPKKSSPRSYFLKMWPHCEQEDLKPFCKNLPKQGMIAGGQCCALPRWEPYIKEKGFLFLPTIGANEYKGSGKKRFKGSAEYRGTKMSEGLRSSESDPIYTHPDFAEVAMGYPLGWSVLTPLETQYAHCKQE